MKFRDVVLLLVGGGLVVFGMLIGDLLENNAHADSHGSRSVEYEYQVCTHDSRGLDYISCYVGNKERLEKKITYTLYKKIDREDDTDFIFYGGELTERVLHAKAVNGWVLDTIFSNGEHSGNTLIFKRVEQ